MNALCNEVVATYLTNALILSKLAKIMCHYAFFLIMRIMWSEPNYAILHNSGRPVYDLLSGYRGLLLALVAFNLMFVYLFASP